MGTTLSFAQDGPPQFRPVEMWACNFNNGKDQGDMDEVYEDLVEDMGETAYAAFQLNPYFVSGDQDFDFIYLGAWADGSTMGSSLTEGEDTSDAWNEAVTCPASLVFASTWLNQPQNDGGTGEFVMTVSDCNNGHAISNGQAAGALRRYNEYEKANGLDVGTLLWYPAFGHGGAEFDFKLVHVYPGAQQLGDSFQWFVDSQAYTVRGNIVDGIVDCDEARVYMGRTLMNNLQAN
jgi:hypothetical protein